MPTETTVPTATLDPTTGMVTGSITWASKPFEGVVVKLCTDWVYKCKGIEYSTVTDAQGMFAITGVEPGDYQVITKNPEQYDETRLHETPIKPLVANVSAGQVVNLGSNAICKHDLGLPVLVIQGKNATFSWNAYAGVTEYNLFVIHNKGGTDSINTSSTRYVWVNRWGSDDYSVSLSGRGPNDLCVEGGVLYFTIP